MLPDERGSAPLPAPSPDAEVQQTGNHLVQAQEGKPRGVKPGRDDPRLQNYPQKSCNSSLDHGPNRKI
jgi:hypothetical protein